MSWQVKLARNPAVFTVLALTLVFALLTMLGGNLEAVLWLIFTHAQSDGYYIHFSLLEDTLSLGQWWRLLTPIFLHFGWLHLTMNMLWLWELGRRIELAHGSVFFSLLVVLSAVFSNFCQYFFSGPAIFGGLSGVLYALLGYCWLYHKINPNPFFLLPRGVVGMMLVWLVICLTGFVGMLGLGQIANAAHVSGLVFGCLAGIIFGVLNKKTNVETSE